MLAALVLAASALAARAPTVDQRVALLEARQMLQSQTLWALQAAVPPDAARALHDLDAHLQQDRERDEKVAQLEGQVALLEKRLQAVELLLGDRPLADGAKALLAPSPAQAGTLVLSARPQGRTSRVRHPKTGAPPKPLRAAPAKKQR